MSRKNLILTRIGQALLNSTPQDYVGLAEAHTNSILIERMILNLLSAEFELLSTNRERAEAYFTHFFHGAIGKDESDRILDYLVAHPPRVTLGYPRTGAEMPCLAIVLEAEQQSETMIGDLIGATTEDEGDVANVAEYRGVFFDCTYGVWIYAEHPDVCAHLYQIAKMILVGARRELVQNGFLDASFSGTELVPNPELLPENMFVRTVRISGKTLVTVPEWVRDPANFTTRVFVNDVVVDGLRGGVATFDPAKGSD